jgi:GNAT superfamily N-acetyltransferase
VSAVLDALEAPGALEDFLRLPAAVYRGDPHYTATSRADVQASLRGSESLHALVAMADGEPVARLVARVSPALHDDRDRPYGMLGSFEALDGHGEAVRELFQEAIAWLHETGAGPIVGPMEGDTWHRYRLSVGPFDDPPFLLEPYNPPYYERLWTANGFAVLERYFSKRVDPARVVAHLESRRQAALAAGYRLRCLYSPSFEDELGTILKLSRRIFSGNFLYTDIRDDEFFELYAGTAGLIDPELIWFARSPAGEDVGFLFAYPDLFRAVAAMRGERNLPAKLRFLWHRRRADAVDFKTLGVLPEHRRSGVAAALFHEGHRQAMNKGYARANHCLFKAGNPSGDLDGGAGRVMREYRLYEWKG